MLLNFFCLSISFIVGIASANTVAIPSQSSSEIIEFSNGFVVQENPFSLLLQNTGALTWFQKSAPSTAVNTIYWLVSTFSYLITAATISFCRLSNLCIGLEDYIPVITSMVTQALKPENFKTAERVLITVMGIIFKEILIWIVLSL